MTTFAPKHRKSAGEALKEAGKKTEDAIGHFFHDVGESFQHMRRNSWFPTTGQAQPAAPQRPQPGQLPPAAGNAPAVADSKQEDDAAMRRHCAALERLVEIGLSPQAAKVAMQHLDCWLVSEAGEAEMAAAEAAAVAAGEPILHVGDGVRLEGLVKNKGSNGKVGTLQAYSSDSNRWKVSLTDGEVYWVKPKLLRPLELKRRPLQTLPADEGQEGHQATSSRSLADAWAKLESRQAAWKEEQEAREIQLLEREEDLRKLEEQLEDMQQKLYDERDQWLKEKKSTLVEQMRKSSAAADAPGSGPAAFDMGSPSLKPVQTAEGVAEAASDDDEDQEAEHDEMWDMDWTSLPAAGGQPGHSGAAPATRPSAPASRARAPSPEPSSADKEALQQKLDAKRRLADLHNGEDITAVHNGTFDKGRMPGVHPSIAEKLEERRRRLEEAEAPAEEEGDMEQAVPEPADPSPIDRA